MQNQTIDHRQRSGVVGSQMKFMINSLLLLSGVVMTLSGVVMQLKYHMGRLSIQQSVWGLEHGQWSGLHKLTAVAFLLFIAIHIWIHWKWFRGVIAKRLWRKNSQLCTLALLMVVVTVVGLVPWLVDVCGGGDALVRDMLIEVHDKLAIVLAVYLVLHFVKRAKRYAKI